MLGSILWSLYSGKLPSTMSDGGITLHYLCRKGEGGVAAKPALPQAARIAEPARRGQCSIGIPIA